MSFPLPAWDPAVEDRFVCKAVRTVTPDTVTVVLAPVRPVAVSFRAGQYVTIEFDIDGELVNRCYTISSPPTRPERIEITVRRTAEGVVSRWLHDGLKPDTVVRLGAPQGEFTLSEGCPSLLLTAGSGITPALSMLRRVYDLAEDCDVVWVHSERSTDRVAYRDELDTIARHIPGLRLLYLTSSEGGRLNSAVLARLVPDLGSREVLACGPEPYLDAARTAVLAAGVAAERFRVESFSFSETPVAPVVALAPGTFRVDFADLGVTADCRPGMTVLDAAAEAGLTLPSSCTQGLCGTCKSTLVSGQVDMNHAGGIRPREIASGKVLLCCSVPLTDLVITR